jgi:hypothetical protein
MADQVQVSCINKTDRYDPHDRIRYVRRVNQNGTRWKLSQEDAIAGIESGKWQFYVSVNGKSVVGGGGEEPVRPQVPQDAKRRRAAEQPAQLT